MREGMKKMVSKVRSIDWRSPKAVKVMKCMAMALTAVIAVAAYSGVAFAAGEGVDLTGVVSPVVGLLKSFVKPLMLIVGAGGFLYCIILGVKYATAEEPQEKEKRKQAIKTAIIGYLLIFILMVVLDRSIEPLSDWMSRSMSSNTVTTTTEAE